MKYLIEDIDGEVLLTRIADYSFDVVKHFIVNGTRFKVEMRLRDELFTVRNMMARDIYLGRARQ